MADVETELCRDTSTAGTTKWHRERNYTVKLERTKDICRPYCRESLSCYSKSQARFEKPLGDMLTAG